VDEANNAELLRRLRGATEMRRRARYRCVLVFLRTPVAVPEVFEGSCGGRILEEARGEGGFGYDPLFLSDDLADLRRGQRRGKTASATAAARSTLIAALGPKPATGRSLATGMLSSLACAARFAPRPGGVH
jgi:XTP/dITP diphosphohydrolase